MKQNSNDYKNLVTLIDEYGFCRAMTEASRVLELKDDVVRYKEKASNTFKEILEIIKNLDERGSFDDQLF